VQTVDARGKDASAQRLWLYTSVPEVSGTGIESSKAYNDNDKKC
jgi:hypothetical protein